MNDNTMSPKFQAFVGIMVFYALLSFVIVPALFYYRKNTLVSAGNGYVAGSVLSLILWFMVGRNTI